MLISAGDDSESAYADPDSGHGDSFRTVGGTEKLVRPVGSFPRRYNVFDNHRPKRARVISDVNNYE